MRLFRLWRLFCPMHWLQWTHVAPAKPSHTIVQPAHMPSYGLSLILVVLQHKSILGTPHTHIQTHTRTFPQQRVQLNHSLSKAAIRFARNYCTCLPTLISVMPILFRVTKQLKHLLHIIALVTVIASHCNTCHLQHHDERQWPTHAMVLQAVNVGGHSKPAPSASSRARGPIPTDRLSTAAHARGRPLGPANHCASATPAATFASNGKRGKSPQPVVKKCSS